MELNSDGSHVLNKWLAENKNFGYSCQFVFLNVVADMILFWMDDDK